MICIEFFNYEECIGIASGQADPRSCPAIQHVRESRPIGTSHEQVQVGDSELEFATDPSIADGIALALIVLSRMIGR